MNVPTPALPHEPTDKTKNASAALKVMQTWFETVDPTLLHDDVEWIVPGYPVAQEIYVGKDAVFNDFFPALKFQFAEWGAEIERMIDGGKDETVIGRYVGKTHGGAPVSVQFIHVWTVEDGKIVRVVSGANTAVFVEVLK